MATPATIYEIPQRGILLVNPTLDLVHYRSHHPYAMALYEQCELCSRSMGLFWRKRRELPSQTMSSMGLDQSPRDIASMVPNHIERRSTASSLRKLRVFVIASLCVAALAAFAIGGLLIRYTLEFPDPIALQQKERAPVIRILAADGTVLAVRGGAHDYTPLDLLPAHVIDAVVATEDRRFFQHNGIDPLGLIRAIFANLRAGRYVQGGSTVTQQLAKNLFLSSERTIGRKAEELALALWLELRLGKRDIIELYLNRVYFGAGAYGIEAAAQRYFEKSARNLTLSESALIAGLLKAPSKFSPLTSPGSARSRARVVLKKMLAAGVITEQAEAIASRISIKFAGLRPNKEATGVEYAIDYVLERMPPLLSQGHSEIIVQTTIDAQLQRHAQSVVEQAIERNGATAEVSQAAVAVLNTDGGILALVGGRSHSESQFNRAVKARRQPGSAFKPLVYLAALENGLTPETTVYDLPVSIAGWSPRNDNGQFKGAVSLRQALSQSINTVAVRLQHDVGVRRIIAVAQRLGIKSELKPGPSLALGSSEVSLLELTGAYTAFANGGRRIEPHIIHQVRNNAGQVLYASPPMTSAPVIGTTHIGAMNDMLNATLVNGTGRRAALLDHPAAGKTGTTQDFRDAWFVGYTAHLAAGVWVGNDQGRMMNNVRGGSLPAQIWQDIMTTAHRGQKPLALPGTARFGNSPGEVPVAPAYREPTVGLPTSDPAIRGSVRAPVPTRQSKGPQLPREQIDGRFIARVLAEPIAPSVNTTTAAQQPHQTPGFPRFAPEGMMSLGVQP